MLYDGVCGLCNRLLRFLTRHDRRAVFVYAPLQSGRGREMVERFGSDPDELVSFYVFANYREPSIRMLARGDAVLFVAGELGWPWRAAVVAKLLPRRVRDRVYDFVGRHRYHVFGRFDTCQIPDPDERARFVDF